MRVFTKANKREVTLNQLSLFFLAKGTGFARLEIIPNGGLGGKIAGHNHHNRRTLKGISSAHSRRIIYRFPEGTDIEIRPIQSNPLTFRNGIEYEFDLGETISFSISWIQFNLLKTNPQHYCIDYLLF